MASAPPLLQAYKTLGDLYGQTSMSVLKRQIVLLSINYYHDCHCCIAAHSMLATLEKMPADVLEALRSGQALADPKLEALRQFATKLAENRSWVDDAEIAAFKAHGYTDETILEIVLAVGYKVLSNYVNHLRATPFDPTFAKFAWDTSMKAVAA